MKKFNFKLSLSVLAVIFLLCTAATQAQTMARDEVKHLVVNAIDYPASAIERHLEGDVVVSFYPNHDGRLEVKEIFSRIPILQNYVYKRITALLLPSPAEEISEPIMLRFTFKLI